MAVCKYQPERRDSFKVPFFQCQINPFFNLRPLADLVWPWDKHSLKFYKTSVFPSWDRIDRKKNL